LELFLNIYLIVGIVTALYFAIAEGELDGSLGSAFMLTFMVFVGPIILIWTGLQTILESPKPFNYRTSSSSGKTPAPPKPKKTDDELIKDYKDAIENLGKIFGSNIDHNKVKVTKSNISQAQYLGALSRKLVIKKYLDKKIVTDILNNALDRIDTVYAGDKTVAISRKAAIKEHLSKINGVKRSKNEDVHQTISPPNSSKKRTKSGGASRKKDSKQGSIGFNLSEMTNNDKQVEEKQTKKSSKDSELNPSSEKNKKITFSVNYD
jgi:hypothetical protein